MGGIKIGVTIPVLNNFKGAIETLHSIKSQNQYDIIWNIIDQWRYNRPLAKAWNIGTEELFEKGCDYALISNDDVIYAPKSIDHLVQELLEPRDPKIILASSINRLSEMVQPEDILNYEDTFDNSSIADGPCYSHFMIGKDFFDKVGTFDENFAPAYWEDNDSHYRIHLLGYRAITTTASSVAHIAGSSSGIMTLDSVTYYGLKWGSYTRSLNEMYKTPYNNPNLTPRDWVPKENLTYSDGKPVQWLNNKNIQN
jgi:hypothetical protein